MQDGQKVWANHGNIYAMGDASTQQKVLPVGIYDLTAGQFGEPLFKKIAEEFEFPDKLYGLETKFIKHILKTYEKTSGNLGILLNGLQGTGKTVTCKTICNLLKLPVILVTKDYPFLVSVLSDLNFDCVIFFDEYDKVFSNEEKGYRNNSSKVLYLMDSVYNSGYRKTFLLTTNDKYIHDRLLERPGRIRYIKQFNNLALESIEEIIDDKLVDKKFKQVLLDFFKILNSVTIDIVKSVIEEVNIHELSPFDMKDILNIEEMEYYIEITEVYKGKKSEGDDEENDGAYKKQFIQKMNKFRFDESDVNSEITCGSIYDGVIMEVKSPTEITVLDEYKRLVEFSFKKTNFASYRF